MLAAGLAFPLLLLAVTTPIKPRSPRPPNTSALGAPAVQIFCEGAGFLHCRRGLKEAGRQAISPVPELDAGFTRAAFCGELVRGATMPFCTVFWTSSALKLFSSDVDPVRPFTISCNSWTRKWTLLNALHANLRNSGDVYTLSARCASPGTHPFSPVLQLSWPQPSRQSLGTGEQPTPCACPAEGFPSCTCMC